MVVLVIAALLLSIYGIKKRSFILMIISAVAYFPFIWYIDNTPLFRGVIYYFIIYILCLVCAFFKKYRLAGVCVFFMCLFTIWVFYYTAANYNNVRYIRKQDRQTGLNKLEWYYGEQNLIKLIKV
jgi:hypothetical protein